jgi:hypothetical protein
MIDNVAGRRTGPEDDRATWQHMTTFTVGLGVSGTLNYRSDYKSSGVVHRRLRRHPHGAQDLAGLADPALNYDPVGRQLRQLEQSQVDRRFLAHRRQRPRHVLQRQASGVARHRARRRLGRRPGPHRLGQRHHGLELRRPSPATTSPSRRRYTTGKWIGDVQGFTIDVDDGRRLDDRELVGAWPSSTP